MCFGALSWESDSLPERKFQGSPSQTNHSVRPEWQAEPYVPPPQYRKKVRNAKVDYWTRHFVVDNSNLDHWIAQKNDTFKHFPTRYRPRKFDSCSIRYNHICANTPFSCPPWMCQNHQLLNMRCLGPLSFLAVLICTLFALRPTRPQGADVSRSS